MSKYRSPELIKKRKKERNLRISLIGFAILILFLFASGITKIPFLRIQEVKVSGEKNLSASVVKENVLGKIDGSYLFWFFSKNSFLIYPKDEIKEGLLKSFPRLESLDLDLELTSGILNVDLVERDVYALSCDLNTDTNCFLVDKNGYIFELASGNSAFGSTTMATSTTEQKFNFFVKEKNKIGEFVFDKEEIDIKDIDSVIGFLNSAGLSPYKMMVNSIGNYEIYFGNGGRVIFTPKQDIGKMLDNFQAILDSEEFKDKEAVKNLEYIDLRFGNKVFYK